LTLNLRSRYFVKSQKKKKITEINANLSQNAYEMYKFINFCNLMKKIVKHIQLSQKKLIFGQTYMKLDGYLGNVKNDGHIADKSKSENE